MGRNLGRSKTLGNSAFVVALVAEHTNNFLRMKELMVVELRPVHNSFHRLYRFLCTELRLGSQ